MSLYLRTMGDLCLISGDGKHLAFPEKGLLILAYLFTQPSGEVSRRKLARLLWQDTPAEASFVNLRQTIARILSRQTEMGLPLLVFDRNTVTVDRRNVSCDFAAICEKSPDHSPFVDLQAIHSVFSGVFLENVEISPGLLCEWRDTQRERSLERLAQAIRSCAELADKDEENAVVRDASARLFQHAPGNSTAQLLTISMDTDRSLNAWRNLFELTEARHAEVGAQAVRAARHVFRSQSSQGETKDQMGPINLSQGPLPRLALLPPTNTPRGVGQMIAQALVEDVTIALAASRRLQIVAPYTAAKIGLSLDKAKLFEKHRISYVVDTRHTFDGDRSFLFVQLVHFANDEVIWAERIPLKESALALQRGDLAARLSATVCDQIDRSEKTREYFERSPQSYYHYLLGQRYLSHLTLPDLRRARREFRSALAQASDFAPALSGMARTFTKEWLLTARGDQDLLRSAEDSARHAIVIGQDLPSGYRELGVAKLLRGAIDESVEALQLAEAMSPHYADIVADLADTLVHASSPDHALEKIRFAIELNPISPDSYLWTAAGASYSLRQYEDALHYIDAMHDNELAIRLAAASWAMLGDSKKAKRLVAKAHETHPDFDLERWLTVVPMRERWQKEHYREGLTKAGF
jgi:DNA-binding SARP family transcriptional activator